MEASDTQEKEATQRKQTTRKKATARKQTTARKQAASQARATNPRKTCFMPSRPFDLDDIIQTPDARGVIIHCPTNVHGMGIHCPTNVHGMGLPFDPSKIILSSGPPLKRAPPLESSSNGGKMPLWKDAIKELNKLDGSNISWEKIVLKLFHESKLNIVRCEMIVDVYDVSVDQIIASIITGVANEAATFLDCPDLDTTALSIVDLSKLLLCTPHYKRQKSLHKFLDKFDKSIHLFIPAPRPGLAEIHFDSLPNDQARRYMRVTGKPLGALKGKIFTVVAIEPCIVCSVMYYITYDTKTNPVCLSCMERFATIACRKTWIQRQYKKSEKDFITYISGEEFDTKVLVENEESSTFSMESEGSSKRKR